VQAICDYVHDRITVGGSAGFATIENARSIDAGLAIQIIENPVAH
jgi:hypothetical protein